MAEARRHELILASASRARRRMMEAAGLEFTVVPSQLDEQAARAAMGEQGALPPPDEIAQRLAQAKAVDISRRHHRALVVGADQVLYIGTSIAAKPADRKAARATLAALRGRSHELHSAAAIARDGEVVWSTVDTARLTMRPFSDAFVEHYLEREGDRLLEAVGAYRMEGPGAQLFERIEGDHFTILGLPLLPLLAQLRDQGLLLS